ncbi:diguanylate cyclase [Marinobacter sp. VGCF2001]|uniref:sensor domain-containing diguanylate cyclase n=1 Tax=Marinobacter sp. VGCF2001 TaxID=3417189 RepID=UPI003CF8A64F
MKSGIPSINLPAFPEQVASTADETPPEGLQAVLDNIDALVYVSDLETHDLLYMNAYGRRIWGAINNRKCWQVLQNSEKPCDFCTNHLLVDANQNPTAPHVWEFQNPLDQRWYQCRDQAIRWTDGRLVRLEIATDISDRKQAELDLREANERAQAAAMEDPLTGLHNRRAFFEFGLQLFRRAQRHGHPLTLIMLDLDHFKQINDRYGHQIGDAVLERVAALMKARIRDCDIVARIGGEEFAILLPDTRPELAEELAKRLHSLMPSASVNAGDDTVSPSASFGISALLPRDTKLEDLMSRADTAMYRSKSEGRSRISLDAAG